MKPCRLIYKSVAVEDVVSNETLRNLEAQASERNAEDGITGLLVLSGNTFLQALEGPAKAVTALFARIASDKRHSQIELVTFEPSVDPLFDDWRMRLVDLYDLPGERRALLAAKYQVHEGDILIPGDLHLVYGLLLDAKQLCDSTPWQAPPR
jgi:hypothetical protein